MVLFRDPGCRLGLAGVFGGGDFDLGDLEVNHIANDSMSSLIIDDGVKVILYEDANYQGVSVTLEGPASFCNSIPHFDDNTLSSMRVFSRGSDAAIGRWKFVGNSTQDIFSGINQGYDSFDNLVTTRLDVNEMAKKVAYGLKFGDHLVKHEGAEYTFTQVNEILGESFLQDQCQVSCLVGPKPTQLFQWVVDVNIYEQFGVHNSFKLKTCNHVCVYDETGLVRPQCPADYCIDDECQTCNDWIHTPLAEPAPLEETIEAE